MALSAPGESERRHCTDRSCLQLIFYQGRLTGIFPQHYKRGTARPSPHGPSEHGGLRCSYLTSFCPRTLWALGASNVVVNGWVLCFIKTSDAGDERRSHFWWRVFVTVEEQIQCWDSEQF